LGRERSGSWNNRGREEKGERDLLIVPIITFRLKLLDAHDLHSQLSISKNPDVFVRAIRNRDESVQHVPILPQVFLNQMTPPPPPPLPGEQGRTGPPHGETLKSKPVTGDETLGLVVGACRVRAAGTRRRGSSKTAIKTMVFFMSLPSMIL